MKEIFKVYKETYSARWGHRVYEVSNFGRVKLNGEFVDFSNQTGYYAIARFYIHRAVAELFIPNPEHKPCVDHIDTNIHNNRFDNLRWVYHKENNNNPLTRQHLSDVLKAIWDNPELRQKQSESQKVAQNRPERKQKQSEVMKGENNPMYGKPSAIRSKHRVYNDPNDHTAGYHYE